MQAIETNPRRELALIVLILAVALPPLLVIVGERDPSRAMEKVCMLSSQETWLRQHGFADQPATPDAYLLPYVNGQPRVTKPPMLIWANMLAWIDLTPDTAPPQTIITRARLMSAFMGLILLGSIYWIGRQMGGYRLAALATLVATTTLFFTKQARTAAYDIHLVAWCTLAAAATIWAMAAFAGEKRSWLRFALGWLLALTCAIPAGLTKGLPIAAVIIAPPLVPALAFGRKRVIANVIALVAVAAVTALVVLQWYDYAAEVYPRATRIWQGEYGGEKKDAGAIFYYAMIIGLVFPWSMWLIVGLVHPFFRRHIEADQVKGQTAQRWFALAWFVLIFIIFSAYGSKQERYILPIIAPFALLVAKVFVDQQTDHANGVIDNGAKFLAHAHGVFLIGASILLPIFYGGTDWLRDSMGVSIRQYVQLPIGLAIALGMVLMAMAVFCWRQHARNRFYAAACITAVWASLVLTANWYSYDRGSAGFNRVIASTDSLKPIINDAPIYHLVGPSIKENSFRDHEEFLLTMRRVVRPLDITEVERSDLPMPRFLLIDEKLPDDVAGPARTGKNHGRFFVDPTGEKYYELWEIR